MHNNFKGNNIVIWHSSAQHHNNTITCNHSVIKDPSITHRTEIIREIEEALEEEVVEEEDLEEVEDH
jgi:hypothetical protein